MSQKVMYQKWNLKGSPREIGRQQGEALQKNEMYLEWLTSPFELPDGSKLPELDAKSVDERCDMLNHYDPGLGDEVRGIAEGLKLPLSKLNKLLYGGMGAKRPCSCSLFGVGSSLTADGHAYIGQSYEFGYEDEYSFVVKQTEGNYSHMGFAFFQVGRFDGINEKGLCIGITSLDVVNPSAGEKEGFSFSFLVRILLDTCATTAEALQKLSSLPICTNANLIIGDKSGDIALAEIQTVDGTSDIAIRRAEPYTYGFNHFISPAHKERLPMKRYFSHIREICMEKLFLDKVQRNETLSYMEIKKVLTDKLPEGLCCHAYEDYFGTLRSFIYDVTTSTVSIAFGSPRKVDYIEMKLETELAREEGFQLIPVEYENETIDEKFWAIV